MSLQGGGGAGGIGGLLAMQEPGVGSDFDYVYTYDANGNVGQLVDLSAPSAPAAVVAHYEYDPYGKTVIEETNPTTGLPTARFDASAFGNPFAWTGQRYDAGVGLYHFLRRSYTPRMGRWNQRDPVGYLDDINLYAYLASDPLYDVDPLGLQFGCRGCRQPPPPLPPTPQPPKPKEVKGSETPENPKKPMKWKEKGNVVIGTGETKDGRKIYNCAGAGCGSHRWLQPKDQDGDGKISKKEMEDFISDLGCTKKGSGDCPAGTKPARFYLAPDGSDFHVMRQEPDTTWCEKNGEGPAVTDIPDPDEDEKKEPKPRDPLPDTYCCPQGPWEI